MRVVQYKTKLAADKKAVLDKEFSINYPEMDRKMNSPEKVARFARMFLRMHEHTEEYLYMICLNVKLDLMSVFELSQGNVNSSVVGIREVFQKALLANAVSIIILHNHPSVDLSPSKEDLTVTKRMVEAGHVIDIDVLYHVIIGDGNYVSLKEKEIFMKKRSE